MKTVGFSLLLSVSLTACQSTNISEYNKRPKIDDECIANGDGTCFRNGIAIPTTNMYCGDPVQIDNMLRHLEDMEKFRWKCLEFGDCGQKKKKN